MKFIIIGLGNYGRFLAEELSSLGHEIIGVDNNEHRVNALKDKIAISYIINVEEEEALSVLPLTTVDAVVVCIGENFGASIKVVSLLKKLKVKHIYARAIDSLHRSILEAFSVDKILLPEEEAAQKLVNLLDYGHSVDMMKLDPDYCIVKFVIPPSFVNFTVRDLQLKQRFDIDIIALQHVYADKNAIGASTAQYHTIVDSSYLLEKLSNGDKLVCIGKYNKFEHLWNSI